jgi:hypothetical protein
MKVPIAQSFALPGKASDWTIGALISGQKLILKKRKTRISAGVPFNGSEESRI